MKFLLFVFKDTCALVRRKRVRTSGISLKLLSLLLLFSVASLSCKKKSLDAVCDTSTPFKVTFRVGESLPGFGFVPTDTIVRFSLTTKTEQPYLSYKWHIGTDSTVFTGSTISRSFTGAHVGQTFPVTLTATGKAGNCFNAPTDTSTITKNVTVMYPRGFQHESQFTNAQLVTIAFLGKWHGSFTDYVSDTFSVHIVNNGPNLEPGFTNKSYGIRVYNLPKGCSGNPNTMACGFVTPTLNYYGYPVEFSYKHFYADDTGFGNCCPKAKLDGGLDPADRNRIIINCRFYTFDSNGVMKETRKTFTGIRK